MTTAIVLLNGTTRDPATFAFDGIVSNPNKAPWSGFVKVVVSIGGVAGWENSQLFDAPALSQARISLKGSISGGGFPQGDVTARATIFDHQGAVHAVLESGAIARAIPDTAYVRVVNFPVGWDEVVFWGWRPVPNGGALDPTGRQKIAYQTAGMTFTLPQLFSVLATLVSWG